MTTATSSLLLYTLIYTSVWAWARAEYSAREVSTHVDTLLAEYDRDVAPAPAVAVTLALDVRHAALDDRAATMRMLADLKMSWSDPRLAWNSTAWEGRSVPVSAARVWRPDLQPAGAGAARGPPADLRARLQADGTLVAVSRLDLTVPLRMDLERWPLDEHTAVYEFASREYSEDELDLVLSLFKNAVVVESGAWDIVSVSSEVVSARARRVAQWSVGVRRRGGALRVAGGAALLGGLALLAAALARPYSQRAPLAAAAAALPAAWLVSSMCVLPAGVGAPRGVVAAAWACGAAAAAALAAAAASRTARRTSPPSAALRALLSRISALYALTPHTECSDNEGGGGGEGGAWAAAARLLDAVLTLMLVIAMLVITVYYFC